jgi:hypothetical protein
MGIFHDKVLIKETEGLLVRRSGKTDYDGVKIFKDLPPELIDGTVAFIGNDHIESFDRDGRIIFNRHGLFEKVRMVKERFFLKRGIDLLLMVENKTVNKMWTLRRQTPCYALWETTYPEAENFDKT